MSEVEYETPSPSNKSRVDDQLRLELELQTKQKALRFITMQDRLIELLSGDLDFQGEYAVQSAHRIHSFPAKFPPQLPQKFIDGLTQQGEIVMDPMMGSGTTLLEASLAGRVGMGFDIDPLASLISNVKTTPIHKQRTSKLITQIAESARKYAKTNFSKLKKQLATQWDDETHEFADYWFLTQTQIEIQALKNEIAKINSSDEREFLEIALSAIIVAKSSGVSLALDLAHTRPHRAKSVVDSEGRVLINFVNGEVSTPRYEKLRKTVRSAFDEFEKRANQNVRFALDVNLHEKKSFAVYGDAQAIPLKDNLADLIVTSPPYAANAIDYMRAHKFTLIWMGYSISALSQRRREYIGGEYHSAFEISNLHGRPAQVIKEITLLDTKKGLSLLRYYSEMSRTLQEMYRVLKPGKCAVLVVGNSVMRNRDTETGECLAELARQAGFECPKIGIRNIDRDRRMLPAQTQPAQSQIQQRMHQESVIGLYKPEE